MTTRHIVLVLGLILTACRPNGPWTAEGGTEAQRKQAVAMTDVAKEVTGDPYGSLAEGGVIILHTDRYDALVGLCYVPPGYVPSGCGGHIIDILVWEPYGLGPDLRTTALSHELCHLVVGGDEAGADACGTIINLASPPLNDFELP